MRKILLITLLFLINNIVYSKDSLNFVKDEIIIKIDYEKIEELTLYMIELKKENEIRIKLDTKLLENVNFNAYLKSESSEYGSYSKFYEGATNKLILKDNSEFEIQLFKKK